MRYADPLAQAEIDRLRAELTTTRFELAEMTRRVSRMLLTITRLRRG